VPDLGKNLFSIVSATEAGMKAVFNGNKVNILTPDANIYMEGDRAGRTMYHLRIRSKVNVDHAAAATTIGQLSSPALWHYRVGHVNLKNLKRMQTQMLVQGLNFSGTEDEWRDLLHCPGCAKGKMHRLQYPQISTRPATFRGERIHTDVRGPMSFASIGGARFFVLFKDEFSGWFSVYFMKNKSEVPNHFETFNAFVKNQVSSNIKTLRSDNAKEYFSERFSTRLAELGIIHESSAPYCPQQNGIAERENRTLMEMARAMIYGSNSKIPLWIWGEATAYSTYILNRIPPSKTKLSPFEIWTGHKPDLSHLRIFGSRTFVHVPDAKRTKLEPKCIEGILVGFCEFTKAYRIYIPTLRKVVTSRDVIIDETKGYDGDISNPHAEPILESEFDPFMESVMIIFSCLTIANSIVFFKQGTPN
jgi:hypothetical protein